MASLEGDYLVFGGVDAEAALSGTPSLPGKKIISEPKKGGLGSRILRGIQVIEPLLLCSHPERCLGGE